MKKDKNTRIKSKEAMEVRVDFHDVNYTSLQNNIQCKTELDGKGSIKSVHKLQALKPTTYFETLTHQIKGNIGCGILGLGMAFKNGGLLLSILMISTYAVVACYNQYILITMANNYKRKYNWRSISFGDTIGTAFENGPPIFQRLSVFIRQTINFFIIVTQLGACSAYFLFITQSLQQLLTCYNININVHLLMLMILPFIWLTALIRQLKYIAHLSTTANLSTVVAIILILHSSLLDLEPITNRKLVGRLEDLPLSLGTMVFALEGISLTLPLQENMKDSRKFVGTFGVLNISSLIVVVLLNTVGFFGYWKFGENVQGSLTWNLKIDDNLFLQGVIVAMMIGIFCTYAIQFFIPILLIMPNINSYVSKWPYNTHHLYEYLLRSILVLFTFFVAEIIPHFEQFSSLIGAIGGTLLAFVFCPLADLVVRRKTEYGVCYWNLILPVFSLVIGISSFVIGTAVTSRQIYNAL